MRALIMVHKVLIGVFRFFIGFWALRSKHGTLKGMLVALNECLGALVNPSAQHNRFEHSLYFHFLCNRFVFGIIENIPDILFHLVPYFTTFCIALSTFG